MIVAIPVDESRADAGVCPSLGRAPYFLFSDTESGTMEFAVNPAGEAQGGAGILSAQFLADRNVDALITVRCGENAAEVLKAAEIALYKASGNSAAENLSALAGGKLSELTRFHAGFHGHA